MKLKFFRNFSAILLILVISSCQENNPSDVEDNQSGHPRILMLEGEEQTI
ncbi:MAG TPA: hypothetical protein VJ939_06210 [Bacteroidales bacterium]|nr:hypothetical protein [Bacteroidales bacterium]